MGSSLFTRDGRSNLIPLHYYDDLLRVHMYVHQLNYHVGVFSTPHPHASTRKTTPWMSTTDEDRSLFMGSIRNCVLFRLDYWDSLCKL